MRRSVVLVGLLAALLIGLSVCGSGYAGPLQPNATFTGGVAFSADGVRGDIPGTLRVDTTASNTSPNTQDVSIQAAFLYNVTFGGPVPPTALTTQATLGGTTVTLNLLSGLDLTPNTLLTYRQDVTAIVKLLVPAKPGITLIPTIPILGGGSDPTSDGLALVVVFSSGGLDARQSVAILDGGQAGSTQQTTVFSLASPQGLDKTIPGFNAVLSLGIQFSFQGINPGHDSHDCGPATPNGKAQFSTVDVNGTRLSSCAGNADNGQLIEGALITVGGVLDSTANPSDPFCQPGNTLCSTTDDELYGIASFLKQGDTKVSIATANPSNDDSIFLAILQITGVIDGVPPPPGVPGPATLILLGTGLLALIAASRLFRKR